MLAALLIAALTPAGAELLPDLDPAAPFAITLRRAGDRRYVSFASAVDNVGRGPLIIDAQRVAGQPAMAAWQVVRSEAGGTRRLPAGSLLHYVRARGHAHWHLMGFARYELRRPDGTPLARRARKQGFCLGDRYRAGTAARLEGAPPRAVFRGECGLYKPHLLRLRQGISVGYGDDYPPSKEGQEIDVTGLRDGRYLLVNEADPGRTLRETRRSNNSSSALLELSAGKLRVLRTCADGARCPGTPGAPRR